MGKRENEGDEMAEHALFRATACPRCHGRYRPGRTLYGFDACRCAGASGGGHTTAECREDTGGCGHVHAEGHVGPAEPAERMPDFGQGGR